MIKKTIITIFIFAIIFITGYIFGQFLANATKQNPQENTSSQLLSNVVTPISFTDEIVNVNGKYIEYTKESFNNDLKRSKNIVLFFYASWCPTCNLLNREILKEVNSIPSNLTIIKIPYDSVSGADSTTLELNKKYNVTFQHTLVQVDSNLNLIKKWVGGNNLNSIVNQLI